MFRLMAGSPLLFLLFAGIITISTAQTLTASFYGNSYLQVPLDDASRQSSVKFHFKTASRDGIIFVAAGNSDYCTVEIQNGHLQVRMNMGSGETSLVSSRNYLNNLEWHEVHIHRVGKTVTMLIDGTNVGTANATGQLRDLNIKVVFLGGIGTFINPYLGSFHDYRGCLADVVFNSFNVFEMIQNRSDTTDVHRVTWGCEDEFNATSDMPISFLYDYAFAAFPRLNARNRGKVSFSIKTRSKKATVVYNAGPSSYSDYVALEILEGRLELSVNKGGGPVRAISKRMINDGKWHQVEMLIDVGGITLTVDNLKDVTPTAFGDNRLLDLVGPFFVGGVGLRARAHAVRLRIESIVNNQAAGSMKGCIANLTVNEKPMGFRDVRVTHGVRPNCLWAFKCADKPCMEDDQCVEVGLSSYKCNCQDNDNCLRPTGDEPVSATQKPPPLLSVRDVYVDEGGISYLTPRNIILNLDLPDLGMTAEDVRFSIYNSTKYGRLLVSNRTARSFTLGDIRRRYVTYHHDGSERDTDTVILKLEFRVPRNGPRELRNRGWGIKLVFIIHEINDRPKLILPPDETLVLVENTQMAITNNVLSIIDGDNRPKELEFHVEYQKGFDIGYFEKTSDGITGAIARIHSFTQEDVNRGKIAFVHRGSMHQEIRIRGYDGREFTGATSTLHVRAIELRLNKVANTGIIVSPGTEVFITGNNLTFKSNAGNNEVMVMYDIIAAPLHGEIQRKDHDSEHWSPVGTFTQEDLDTGRIRYIHRDGGGANKDGFRFKVSVLQTESEEMGFQISIESVDIRLERNQKLLLDNVIESRITSHHLKAVSSLSKYTEDDIYYTILVTPSEGSLYKTLANRRGHMRSHRLPFGGNFTQKDLKEARISYKLKRSPIRRLADWFKFRIYVPGAASPDYTFNIEFVPRDTSSRIVNKGLTVVEGDSAQITQDDLFVTSTTARSFRYNIIQQPQYGFIHLMDPISKLITEYNISSFTSDQIIEGKIIYKHDDSETMSDSFRFLAVPDKSADRDEEINETFNIKIRLKNDNQPKRVNPTKVFVVIANRGRAITRDDLFFSDADIDSDVNKIKISWMDLKTGLIVSANNHNETVYDFEQQDILDGKLYFKHFGRNHSKSTIYVKDQTGQPVAVDFEIAATPPFLKITMNASFSLFVQKGKRQILTDNIVEVETNLDITAKDVTVVVTKEPRHGRILRNNVSTNAFTLEDIQRKKVTYEHNGMNLFRDNFEVDVEVERKRSHGNIPVIVHDGKRQMPFTLNSTVLMVNENGRKKITNRDINVTHPRSRPSQIKFKVKFAPRQGELRMRGQDRRVSSFTQADINNNLVEYYNTKPGQESDFFMYEVTNGKVTLSGLEFRIHINLKEIKIKVIDLNVVEGESIEITSREHIRIYGGSYDSQNMNFFLVNYPKHGKIARHANGVNTPIYIFSLSLLRSGHLRYIHDGSDTVTDEFTFMGIYRDTEGSERSKNLKKSRLMSMKVLVRPSNDGKPVITNNEVLPAWTKSKAVITDMYLLTEDPDTPPRQLVYHVSQAVINGHVALAEKPRRAIRNFTQWHINQGKVVFVPTNQKHAEFKFEVTDGKFPIKQQRFVIKARPLELRVITNNPLEVFPRDLVPIKSVNLRSETNDANDTDRIVYRIVQGPTKGFLQRHNRYGGLEDVYSFTQMDINKERIVYEQRDLPNSWSTEDMFLFNVTSGIENDEIKGIYRFNMSISYGYINDGSHSDITGITVRPISCHEGDEKIIHDLNLDISGLHGTMKAYGFTQLRFNYKLISLPKYGSVLINHRTANIGATFIQDQIRAGNISYKHGGTDTLYDTFKFVVEMTHTHTDPGGGRKQSSKLVSKVGCTFNITIMPRNDKPPILEVNKPLEVVKGYIGNISSLVLMTTDKDTPPNEINYRIVRFPMNGRVELRGNEITSSDQFTQEDVDNNLVKYIQDANGLSDSFDFTVNDGLIRDNDHEIFEIQVKNVVLNSARSEMYLKILQGTVSATITKKHLDVVTNGDRHRVIYNITSSPSFGMLYLQGIETNAFSQVDIDNGNVLYLQTDINRHIDSFRFQISDGSGHILDEDQLDIFVVANVKHSRFIVPESGELVLSLDELNASELAAMTQYDPRYTISNGSKYGAFTMQVPAKKKNSRSKRGFATKVDAPIITFTHKQIMEGEIRYQVNETKMRSVREDINDSVQFMLAAENVQTAPGSASFVVKPIPSLWTTVPSSPNTMALGTSEPKATTVKVTKKPVKTRNGRISNDHLFIVISVCVLSLLAILLFIIVKCIKKRKKRRKLKKMLEKSHSTVIPVDGEAEPLAGHKTEPASPVITQDGRVVKFADPAVVQPAHIGRGLPSTPPPPRSPPDTPRSEVSRTVPSLKVTPMTNSIDSQEDQSRSSTLRSGGSGVDQVTFGWESIDPELLEHCRTTNPILHKNKYWV